jgi:hypothetical protein
VAAVRDYLSAAYTETAQELGKKAVILLAQTTPQAKSSGHGMAGRWIARKSFYRHCDQCSALSGLLGGFG